MPEDCLQNLFHIDWTKIPKRRAFLKFDPMCTCAVFCKPFCNKTLGDVLTSWGSRQQLCQLSVCTLLCAMGTL